MCDYFCTNGIVGFNIPLDTFRRRFYGSNDRSITQCHSTEGQRSLNQILLICLAQNCALMYCFVLYLLDICQIDGNATFKNRFHN